MCRYISLKWCYRRFLTKQVFTILFFCNISFFICVDDLSQFFPSFVVYGVGKRDMCDSFIASCLIFLQDKYTKKKETIILATQKGQLPGFLADILFHNGIWVSNKGIYPHSSHVLLAYSSWCWGWFGYKYLHLSHLGR